MAGSSHADGVHVMMTIVNLFAEVEDNKTRWADFDNKASVTRNELPFETITKNNVHLLR